MRTLVAIGTWLYACAGHGASIGIYAHYHALVHRLHILDETCDAARELLWVICQLGLVHLCGGPTVVDDDGIVSGIYQTLALHATEHAHEFVVRDVAIKPVPCQPRHHRCGRLQMGANGKAYLCLRNVALGILNLHGIGVLAFLHGCTSVDVFICIALGKAVFLQGQGSNIAKVHANDALAYIGHELVHVLGTGQGKHSGGTCHGTHRGVYDVPYAVHVTCRPEVQHTVVLNATGEVPCR